VRGAINQSFVLSIFRVPQFRVFGGPYTTLDRYSSGNSFLELTVDIPATLA